MTKTFKIGDLVRIKEGTNSEKMPKSRIGHVHGLANTSRLYNNEGVTTQQTDQYNVYMTNGEILKFHVSYLELVDDSG